MRHLRQLRLRSGLPTGTLCLSYRRTFRKHRWWEKHRLRVMGRGSRGRLGGRARRRRRDGGDSIALYACLCRILCAAGRCVTAGGRRYSLPHVHSLAVSQLNIIPPLAHPDSPRAMSRLAKRHPDLLVSPPAPHLRALTPAELQLQPGLLVHRCRPQAGVHHSQLRPLRKSPRQQHVSFIRRSRWR